MMLKIHHASLTCRRVLLFVEVYCRRYTSLFLIGRWTPQGLAPNLGQREGGRESQQEGEAALSIKMTDALV